MRRRHDQDGGSLVELVVASFLTIVATAAALSAIAGPVGRLLAVAEPDNRRAEIEGAADMLARVVRSARHDLAASAVVDVEQHRLVLRVGPPSVGARVDVAVEEGALRITTTPDAPEGADADVRTLLSDVAPDAVTFAALGLDGHLLDHADGASVMGRAIAITIATAGIRTERIVSLRAEPVHARAGGW